MDLKANVKNNIKVLAAFSRASQCDQKIVKYFGPFFEKVAKCGKIFTIMLNMKT
jgi:hypothetical protein